MYLGGLRVQNLLPNSKILSGYAYVRISNDIDTCTCIGPKRFAKHGHYRDFQRLHLTIKV